MPRSCKHSDNECKQCFKERIASVGVASSATPTRRPVSQWKRPKDKPVYNNWEKGIPTDGRGMPYLDEHGVSVNTKKLAETRHKYREFQKPNVTTD